jgi:hypothetical protein
MGRRRLTKPVYPRSGKVEKLKSGKFRGEYGARKSVT